MAVTYDSLSYSKRLRDAGVPREQADAHAEAALYLFRALDSGPGVLETAVTTSEAPAKQVDFSAAMNRATWRMTVLGGGIIIAGFAVAALIILRF